ncbi:Type 1 glutamine amidotransferase-like domain-containing protein [Achromobacter aloeverae]
MTQRILAIGGGGFLMEESPSPIDALVRDMTGKARPKICFIGTASGDLPLQFAKFDAAYGYLGCEASHLAFFRDTGPRAIPLTDIRTRLLDQDAIFVGGGNTKAALGVWKEWGLDNALREAGNAGILLAGMSAGALCWFESGVTDSFSPKWYRPVDCLGFIPGGCAVHYNGDPLRRESLHAACAAGGIGPSIAIDDYAAVLYANGKRDAVYAWKDGSTAHLVDMVGGQVVETALPAAPIRS